MITVQHLNNSRSQRVLWLLEELGLEYDIKRYQLEKAKAPFFVKPVIKAIADRAKSGFIQPQIDLHLNYMEAELRDAPWFAGQEFTAADVQMSLPLEAAAARPASCPEPFRESHHG